MTVCAFIHPYNLPTIISDLIVTERDAKHAITPSNFGIKKLNGRSHPVRLVRKSLLIEDDPAVFAFAGDGEAIIDFQEYLPLRYKYRDSRVRPMRFIGDLANDFNAERKNHVISVIGFCRRESQNAEQDFFGHEVDKYPEGYYMNVLYGGQPIKAHTKNFLEVSAIGTGARQIVQHIVNFDQLLDEREEANGSPESNLYNLLGALNSMKLYADAPLSVNSTWGGYLEATTLSEGKQPVRRKSWTHIAYTFRKNNNSVTFKKLGKQIHYAPNASSPFISIRLEDRRGRNINQPWKLRNSLHEETPDPVMSDFQEFAPDFVTVCLACEFSKRTWHKTLAPSEAHLISRDGNLNISVDKSFLHKFHSQIELYEP